MTPQKIKARELVEKYYTLKWQHYTSTRNTKIIGMNKMIAKQCAIIAVEMILESKKLDNLFYHVDHKLLAEELNMPIATLKNYAYELRVQDHRELPVQYMKGKGGMFNVDEFKCWYSGQRI